MAASFTGFGALIKYSPHAISLIDAQGEILYGSPFTTKLFGYKPEELLGRNCFDLIHPEDRDRSSLALNEVLRGPPQLFEWEARFRHKDGHYSWVESTLSNLLTDVEVQAIMMHQRDIDARKAAELEKQRHAEELAAANLRLEEFAYTAAHDLREPLRAMSICVDMLTRKMEVNGEAQALAKFVVDGAARMSVLIDDLLSFARAGVHEPPQEVDLMHAAAQAVHNLAGGIGAKAEVTVRPLPIVLGHTIHLTRLFQNLFSNAVKYRRSDPVEVQVTAEREGLVWVIRVKDNGVGVAPENQARIFLPFVRLATGDVPGTGLGLAVCKKIVEERGGRIWVNSEAGAGATFCFTIAVMEQGRTAAAPADEGNQPGKPGQTGEEERQN